MRPDLIDAWLSFLEHNRGRTRATVVKYGGYVRRLERRLAESSTPLVAATFEQLEHWCGAELHRENMHRRTRRAVVAAVKSFYRFLHRTGVLASDPSARLVYPDFDRNRPRSMFLESLQKIINEPDLNTFVGLRDSAIMHVLAGCGLRVSGLVNLNQSDLLFLDDGDGAYTVALLVKEKGGKQRLVPAPDEVEWAIRAYLGHEELERIDRTLPDGEQVLFVSTRNRRFSAHEYHGDRRRLSARSVLDMLVKYGKRVGIPPAELHPHAIRHLYGIELAEDDVDLLKRQALMGHEDPKSTQIYTRLAIRKLIEVIKQGVTPLDKIRTPYSELAKRMRRKKPK